MSTNSSLRVGSIDVNIVRKSVKNVHLSVLPPSGRVRVTAPLAMKNDAIRTLLATRLPWIKHQQGSFQRQERQTKRKYVSGESHYMFGRRLRLELVHVSGKPSVSMKNKSTVRLQVRPKSSFMKRQEIMTEWYRENLYVAAQRLMSKWQKKMGVKVQWWGIRQMKTRWGSCNHAKKRILLNLELAKKPLACIEYVVVHELAHIVEKKHNEHFTKLMTKYLPKWRGLKDELNRFILSHEEWEE